MEGGTSHSIWIWLTPSLLTLFLYGIGQGLIKKWIAEVPPARFCLYFVVAKTIVNLGFFWTQEHPPLLAPEGHSFMVAGIVAYLMDGAGWILYFLSIVHGPITIVGTLSAAYPALTVLFARIFLGELLSAWQYLGVGLVIGGCLGLSYAPPEPGSQPSSKRWIAFAAAALVLWGAAQTIVKYAYELPQASEANLSIFNTIGGVLTLGVYGWLRGRLGTHSMGEWGRSFLPMGMMAAGDLGVIIAARTGPISLVSPLTGAYPVVTLAFAALVLHEKITKLQGLCIAMILAGMVLSPGSA